MGDAAAPGEVRAAGAVLWRHGRGGTGVEVAVVHRPRYDDWSFPKGKAKRGEHPLVNAVREVTEETGVRPVLGRALGRTSYQAHGRPKRVDYWAATPAPPHRADRSARQPGRVVGDDSFVGGHADGLGPDREVDALEWLPVDAAMRRLSYEHDAAILREFAQWPAATVPYVFLRHAAAGAKNDGPKNDVLRPLDGAGTVVAGELAGILACLGPARTFSSATARCVDTVLPYAILAEVQVTADPVLLWGAGPDTAGYRPAATALMAALFADRAATVVCGHGETLPELLAQACTYFGVPVPGDPALGKGEFWVLHVAAPGEAAQAAGVPVAGTVPGAAAMPGSGAGPGAGAAPGAAALAVLERHAPRVPGSAGASVTP